MNDISNWIGDMKWDEKNIKSLSFDMNFVDFMNRDLVKGSDWLKDEVMSSGEFQWINSSSYALNENFYGRVIEYLNQLRDISQYKGIADRKNSSIDGLRKELSKILDIKDSKLFVTGWPMEYLNNILSTENHKEDIILFPHRLAPEKQLQIFKHLESKLPEYKFIVCQEHNLTKKEYHNLLSKAKIVFSANLQETLGISCYEGALSGALPIVPDRLSYSEMYMSEFKYTSIWTESYESYLEHSDYLVKFIQNKMNMYDSHSKKLPTLINKLNEFFKCDALLIKIFK
jgi:hypothetical protein